MTIHQAAEAGDLSTVTTLLANGVDPNTPEDGGTTPLHCAVGSGVLPVVLALLRAGADPHRQSENGITALHSAGCLGYSEIVAGLLSSGADPNVLDNRGCSCLDAALLGLQLYLDGDTEWEGRQVGVGEFMDTFGILARHGAVPKQMGGLWEPTVSAMIHSVVARNDVTLAGMLAGQCPASLREVDDDSGVSALHVAALCPGTQMM